MNLIFLFQRFVLFFIKFSSTLRVITIEVFTGEFFAYKNLNQWEKFHLHRGWYFCAYCKNIAYPLTEILVIGWHTQIVLRSLLTHANLNLGRDLGNT